MKPKWSFVLTCLLAGAIVAGCSPSQAERDARATRIAASIFATQTAEAPTLTPTPLPLTPTPTSMPTPLQPTPSPLPPTLTPLPPTLAPESMGITVTGIITNLVDAREQCLTEDSYLQLVRVSADGRLALHSDDQGRIVCDSELTRIPIPHNGAFTFQAENLEPGTHLIAAQLTEV